MWIRTTNGIEFIPMTTTMQGLYVPKIKYCKLPTHAKRWDGL